jgi:hypothetical protein
VSSAGRGRQPMGNRIVLAVLRSRWHRLLSGSLAQLTVRGRRTGQVFCLPVQYARDRDRLVLLPAHAERKRWWRNLDGGAVVRILLAGRDRRVQAQLVRAGTPAFRDAAAVYGRRFPRAARTAASSPVLVTVALTALDPGAALFPPAPGVGNPPGTEGTAGRGGGGEGPWPAAPARIAPGPRVACAVTRTTGAHRRPREYWA